MTNKTRLQALLYGLDKYNYCLRSEIEDTQTAIERMLIEAYTAGMSNIDNDGWQIHPAEGAFLNWLNKEI